MKTDEPLQPRHREILHSIVRAYIDTGEPVGSGTISKRRNNQLSPASIRNVMADLAEAGYLSQPHTSAGRIPTEKAFRFYVRSLTARPHRLPTMPNACETNSPACIRSARAWSVPATS